MTNRWVLPLSSLLLLGAMSRPDAAMAPVRCHHPHGAVAAAICASPEYIAMDREIAALTDRGMAEFTKPDQHRLAQTELNFFHLREGCGWAGHNSAHPGAAIDECLRARMDGRVKALRAMVDRGGFERTDQATR